MKKIISFCSRGKLVFFSLLVGFIPSSELLSQEWDGQNNGNWSVRNNWNPNGVPANNANLLFQTNVNTTININGPARTANSVTFGYFAGANVFTFNNNQLTISNGITNLDDDRHVFNSTLRLGNSQTWHSVSGGLQFAAINLQSYTLTNLVESGLTNLYSGVISGGGGNMVFEGEGTSIIYGGGNNTFTGTLIVLTNATVIAAKAGAFGTTAGQTTVSNGGTISLSNNITTTAAEILNLAGAGAGGNGALQNLAGNNNWNGNINLENDTTIRAEAGTTLTLGSTGANRRLTNNGNTLTFEGNGNITVNAQISGAGGVVKNGTGTLLLSYGLNTAFSAHSGSSFFNQGTTILDLGEAPGSPSPLTGTVTVGNGVDSALMQLRWFDQIGNTTELFIREGSQVVYQDFYVGTKNDVIGLLRMEGGATISNAPNFDLILNSNVVREVTGNTSAVIDGRLDLGGGNRSFIIADNATATQDMVVGAAISNGGLIKEGAGTLTLSNANNYAGATIVRAGVLETAVADSLGGTGSLVISNGAVVSNSSSTVDGAGIYSAASRSATVTGAGSQWTNPGTLHVGNNNINNSLFVSNGGAVFATNLIVGANVSSTGNELRVDSASSRVIVTNATGSARVDIRRGQFVQNDGLVEVDNLLLTNGAGVYRLNGGTLNVKGNTTNNNGQVYGVGNGTSTATYNAEGGNHVFASGLRISNNGTMNMTNNIIVANTTVQAGGNLTVEGGVTNQGNFVNQSTLPVIDVSEASGDIFRVTGDFTNNGTINLNHETGGGVNPGFQGIDFAGASFENSGSILWSFDAPPSGGLGTPDNPYFGGVRSSSNIFAPYQDASGFFTSGFIATGLGSNQFLKTHFTGGFYYLAVIPEPSTYALLGFGAICMGMAIWRRKRFYCT